MRVRVRISASHGEIKRKLKSLRKLDADNQKRLSATSGRVAAGEVSKQQLYILTESVFFSAFKSYENFIEEIFVLYCLGKKSDTGKHAVTYLTPKNYLHAIDLMKSSMPFLDWAKPDSVINRSELYLKDGQPVKSIYTANRTVLASMHKIRNHIAHNSNESLNSYKKILRSNLLTLPVSIPSVGEYLLLPVRTSPTENYLDYYLNQIEKISHDLVV